MSHFGPAAAPKPAIGVRARMALVLLALCPGIALQVARHGSALLIQIALAIGFALAFEAAMLALRRESLRPFPGDLTAPVSAVLFALCVPALAPWWVALLGMGVAIVVVKHCAGGLGRNLFNPAMAACAVVFVLFGDEVAQWTLPGQAGFADAVRAISGQGSASIEASVGSPIALPEASVALAWLIGGALLLRRGVVRWQVPFATLATSAVLAFAAASLDPSLLESSRAYLLDDVLLLAAFFIATDPVTGCITPRGRLLFGTGVALLLFAAQAWGQRAGGLAFAILLMNCAAPALDLLASARRPMRTEAA